MNMRNSVRYDSDLLPESMSTVTISWAENSKVESYVVNFCTHGIRVSLPSEQCPAYLPKKNDTVKVHMPIYEQWFTGMCIYATNENDQTVSMGIYFYNPSEHNLLHSLLVRSLNDPPQMSPFVSYEWEELVTRLCDSEDPDFKCIGYNELAILKEQYNVKKVTVAR